jgi:flagellar protein FlaG
MRIEGVSSLYIDKNINSREIDSPVIKQEEKKKDDYTIGEGIFIDAINSTNEKLETHNRRIEFSIHDKTNDIMVKIVDRNTNEVIREIPPEKIKNMLANMLERAGLLVDERA